jgi:capsular exopolysaccharide synthesis family protein
MQEEARTKLMSVEEMATQLDLKRDYGYYGYGHGVTGEREGTHLRDYWRIVRRHIWIPIGVMALVTTAVAIYNLRSPSIFEGVTKIQIERQDQVVNLKDVQINMGGGEDSQYINTQLKILQSPRVAWIVVRTLDLEHNAEFLPEAARPFNPREENLQIIEGESDEQADIDRLRPFIDTLLANAEVRPVRETRLVEIHYKHGNKELARKIADTWADAFIKHTIDERYKANDEAGEYLEKSIAEYKGKLKEAEERLQNYLREKQIIDFGRQESTVTSRLAELNHLLLQAENERKNSQLSYELSRGVADVSTVPEVQRDPVAQELNKKITELNQLKEKLLVEFTPEWPSVKQVNQQLEQLQGELRASHQRILITLDNQYKTAVAREDNLRKAFAQQRAETMQQNEGAISAKMLQAEVDSYRQMFDSLLQSQKGVEVSAVGLLKSNIRVTETSPPPQSPVAPKRLQNILLAMLLSLIGGVGIVLFRDYLNNKVETVEDIDRYLRLPALGVIPVLDRGGKAKRLLDRGEESQELAPANARAGNGSVILSQVETNSAMAESYRQLRTALLLSSAGHAPRTILFTSSQPAEGKTTTSVNTAISLAQTGSAVLVIDADLRRPRVHKIFGLKNNAGLSNFLAGEADLVSLIQVAMPNLYVLPVGPLPPNPAELLGSTKMKQAIETLSANFDYVVIDSPPVSSFADSLILSSLVDGVIFVIKAGLTPREMAQRTKAHLQSVGAKILGVVVNQIKLQPHDYYYYSTYYSRYYYGEKEKGAENDD